MNSSWSGSLTISNKVRNRETYRVLTLVLAALMILALFPPVASAAESSVSISETLTPRDLTVGVGDTVTWTNDDGQRHRMRTTSGPDEFDSGNLDPGMAFSFTFDLEGTYLYMDDRDRDNSSYYGTIIVTESTPVDPGEPVPPPPPTGDVAIVNDTFRPGSITVNVGGTVTWSNQDREHTVTARDGSWDSGIFDIGQSYTRTFNSPGTIEYFCIIHPDMIGTVVVVGDGGEPPPPPPPPSPPPPPPPPPPPGTGDVSIIDNDFAPATMTVSAGSTVRWVNNGILPHTATAAGQFDSGILMAGETWSRTFDSPGTFNYICTLHPEMTATVLVTGSDGAAPAPVEPAPTPPTPAPSPPSEGGAPAPAPSGAISVIDNDYQPRSRTVTVGSTVSWVNNGVLPHTVTAAGQFDSGIMMAGDTWSRTFNSPGTFDYICTLHPEMTGTIIVSGTGGATSAGGSPVVGQEEMEDLGSTTEEVAEPPSAGAIGTAAINMIDNAYDPLDIEVEAGSSITWTNIGELPHTVTARDESYDSGFVTTGESWTRQYDQVGEYEYFCIIHPEMVGRVIVVAASDSADRESSASGITATGTDSPQAAAPVVEGRVDGGPPAVQNVAMLAVNGATLFLMLLAAAFVALLIRDSRQPSISAQEDG